MSPKEYVENDAAAPRWLASLWPSTRIRRDPLGSVRIQDRYAPVSVANWKLTPWMKRRILEGRVPQSLTFAADQRLTVVIPFRDRDEHLRQLLPVLRAELERQGIPFGILVVEQDGGGLFNRGRLINIGVRHAADRTDYYCLHDVDAIPHAANYACPSQPLRLVSQIDTENGPTARTDYYFSGAVSIRKEQLVRANGYSNEYWGWGKEDDDFFFRLLLAGCLCYFDMQGRFQDLPNPGHQQVQRKSAATPPHVRTNRRRRSRLLRGLIDFSQDGLSTLHFEIADRQVHSDHERIRVRW